MTGVDLSHRWMLLDEVIVSFTIPGDIADETWEAFLDDLATRRPRAWVALSVGKVVVDAAQRRRLTLTVVHARCRVLVVTDNRTTRGLSIGVAWLGATLDAVSWQELEPALEGLALAEGTHRRLLHEAREFHAAFGYLDD